MIRLRVGNLPSDMNETEFNELFAEFGRVFNYELTRDIFTGRCRGFGFVDMEGHEARAAIAGLNGKPSRETAFGWAKNVPAVVAAAVDKSHSDFTARRHPISFLPGIFMAKNLYVSNLSYGVDTQQLQQIFEAYGDIQSAKVIMDRETGRSRGFGFVEMSSDSDANTAISALNGKEVDGRAMIVNEARPREEGSNSFGSARPRPAANRRY